MLNQFYNKVIVTGSNKGIGWEIVKGILKLNLANTVILCSRDEARGQVAIDELVKLNPEWKNKVEQGILDLNSQESIKTFKGWFEQKHKHVDCIVNNAGFAFKGDRFDKQVLEETFLCNFDGTLDFQETMSDCMSEKAKVIFVASMAGGMAFKRIQSKEIQGRFLSENLDMEKLKELKKEMIQDWVDGTYESKGWPKFGYGLSKMFQMFGVDMVSKTTQYISKNIQMYTMCPGWCKSDMAGHERPPKTAEDGADTVLWQMQKPREINDSEQGAHFTERAQKEWKIASA